MNISRADERLFEVAQAGISSISVEGLHAQFTYEIEPEVPIEAGLDRFLIIYGDNGTGKTTVLRMTYHLLSAADRPEHRRFLLGTAFERFEVKFRDGRSVLARRDEPKSGRFRLSIRSAAGEVFTATIRPVRNDQPESNEAKQLAEIQRSVFPEDVYYMSDERRIFGDALPVDDQFENSRQRAARLRRQHLEGPADRDELLQRSLERTAQWIRDQAFGALNTGSFNSNKIYVDVARSIATPSALDDLAESTSLEELIDRVAKVGETSAKFAKFGLISQVAAADLLEVLNAAPVGRAGILVNVLLPYVKGVEAQHEALQRLHDILVTFSDELNAFFVGKQAAISFPTGVQIYDHHGRPLNIGTLSSGEKQLLLLMTSTFFGRDQGAIYIIDEPELSLNMKWQRQLVRSLVRTTSDSDISFFMASHSFELMAGARDRVVQLTPNSSTGSL